MAIYWKIYQFPRPAATPIDKVSTERHNSVPGTKYKNLLALVKAVLMSLTSLYGALIS